MKLYLRASLFLLFAVAVCLPAPAWAQSVTILHSFRDGSVANDGIAPQSCLLQAANGNLYGVTSDGGSTAALNPPQGRSPNYGFGTAFEIMPSGQVTILHSFGDGSVPNDAIDPVAIILATDGNFYGTSSTGGTSQCGTVFKMTPAGQITILHSFGDGSVPNDGTVPFGGLVQGTDGNFYGTTIFGGATVGNPNQPSGYGTVYMITPSGQVSILHSFNDGTVPNDGYQAQGNLVEGPDGNFYGTTFYGGSTVGNPIYPSGFGTIFKMTASGQETILHSFEDGSASNDGGTPEAGLTLGADGNFYGAAWQGGSTTYYGTVFKMTPSGQVTTLHSFKDGTVSNDGAYPATRLIQGADGNFYGRRRKAVSPLKVD